MKIHCIRGFQYDSNIYVITGDHPTVIDTGTGMYQDTINKTLKEILDPKTIKQIILTHEHFDHSGGVKNIHNLSNETASIIAHPQATQKIEQGKSMFAKMLGGTMPKMPVDTQVDEGATLQIGDDEFTVLHTPGHTPGCICLYSKQHKTLFSGDTVFAHGSFGRTDFPGGSHSDLKKSIKRLTNLDIEYLYPGHEEWIEGDANAHIKQSLQNISYFG